MLKPVGKSILFVFLDEVAGGWFYDKSSVGLFIPKSVETSATQCRWGKIVAVGKRVNPMFQPKMNILIEPMRWTLGMEHDGIKVWRTVEESIAGIEEVEEETLPA